MSGWKYLVAHKNAMITTFNSGKPEPQPSFYIIFLPQFTQTCTKIHDVPLSDDGIIVDRGRMGLYCDDTINLYSMSLLCIE